MGTGAEQKITITASTNLSEADIDKAVKEAEQFANEDKKKKEGIEVRNQADSLVYQTEKTLSEVKDKLSEDEINGVQAEVDKLKEALKGTDTDAIKAQSDALTQKFSSVAQKIYAQANPQGANPQDMGGGAGAQQSNPGADDAYEADYTVVDDDNK